MNTSKRILKLDRKKFIIYFAIIYFAAIFLLINNLGRWLIDIQILLIKTIFGTYFNYNLFVFVPECSGLISIITYFQKRYFLIPYLWHIYIIT
jgi:hypothetical protein